MQFPVRNSQGRPGHENALRACREHTDAVGDALLQLVSKSICHLRAARRVVEERNLGHEQGVFATDGQRVGLARRVHARKRRAFLVDEPDGLAQLFGRELDARNLLHHIGKRRNFVRPFLNVLRTLHLRHIHEIGLFVSAENFVRFLLAVARGFADIDVGNAEVRAGFTEMSAERRLDERAYARGQHLFAFGHPKLRAAAQARDGTAARDDDFIRHEHAERAEDLAALFLQLDELGRTDAVNFGYDEVVEGHAFRTVFLGQVDIAKGLRQSSAQKVVRVQIHAEIFPHCMIVSHVSPLLRAR